MDEEVPNEPVKIITEIRAILAMWVLRALSRDLEPAFQSDPSISFGRSPKTGKIEYILCDSLESLVFAFSKIQNLLIEKSFHYETSCTEKSDDTFLSKITVVNDSISETNVQPVALEVDTPSLDEEKYDDSCIEADTTHDCDDNSILLDKSQTNDTAWSVDTNEPRNNILENNLINEGKEDISNENNPATVNADHEENGNCGEITNPLSEELEEMHSLHDNSSRNLSRESGLRRSTRKRLANVRYALGIKKTVFEDEENSEEDEQGFDHHSKKNYEEAMPYKYFCEKCSFKTKRISHLEKHNAIHKKVKTLYSCGQCSFTSMRLGHLRRHESSHSAVLHKCDKCTYFTDDMKLLIRHRKQKHHSYRNSKDGRLLNCKECAYETPRQHLFDRHKRIHCVHHHQCTQCPYRTWRKEHYVRHVNNVHKNKRPYLCHLCGKAFKRGDSLRHHHMIFHITDPSSACTFTCEVCGKSFRTHSHLDEHKAVHSNVRSFLCEICGSSFKTRSVQRKHIQTIHQNPRSKSCVHCDKKFNTVFALRRHLKIHDQKETMQAIEDQQSVIASENSEKDDAPRQLVPLSEVNKINEMTEENQISVLTLAAPTLQAEGDGFQETVLATELIGTLQPPSALQNTEITSTLFLLTSTTII